MFSVIDCQTLQEIDWDIEYASVRYINTTTTYGSFLEVTLCINNCAFAWLSLFIHIMTSIIYICGPVVKMSVPGHGKYCP